jgi:signal transduction histidine kinase/CheY-like chemotaxis protein
MGLVGRWLRGVSGRDALERRQAAILQVILIVVCVVLVAAGLSSLLRGDPLDMRSGATANLVGAGLVGGLLGLLRRGHFRVASGLFVVLAVVGFGQSAGSADPIERGPYLVLLMLPIVVAGLLLPRALLGLTALGVFIAGQVAIGEGLLRLGNFVWATLFVTVAVDQFGGTVRAALDRAVAHEQELEVSEGALATRTAELQATVASLESEIAERRRIEAERDAMQERILQSQRLESIGRLAGGVAHDFNNLLTAIRGYADLIGDRIGADEAGQADVEAVRHASDQAASLTRQLLAFSRNQELRPAIVDLNDVVRGVEPLLRRLLGERVTLVVRPVDGLWAVLVDPSQMESVIVNLAVNARDAMKDGGRLTIETANVDLDREYARDHAEVVPGPYAMVAVSDTGAGIDDQTIAHIFEPFFTTKGLGKGTGLGLATVYGTVRQSGGHIWVYSEPGRGTTFKIYLPRTEPADVTPDRAMPAALPPRHGRETVLVVEDEAAVRELVVQALERRGYPVIVAASGEEALVAIAERGAEVGLLLTDVVMPGLGGLELIDEVRRHRAGIRFICMSGYTSLNVTQRPIPDDVVFLEKPFTLARLDEVIRSVLGD